MSTTAHTTPAVPADVLATLAANAARLADLAHRVTDLATRLDRLDHPREDRP